MQIGCHVSMAGGIDNAPQRAKDLGCETFQIFSRSPRGGPAPEITPQIAEKFRAEMKRTGMTQFVIHTPYYINLGSVKNNIYYGSVSVLRQELERGSILGGRYVMTHLGSFGEIAESEGIKRVITGLQKVLDGYKGETKLLLEIAAGSGKVIGHSFTQLGAITAALTKSPAARKKYSGFGGICLDSQHAYASGYDIATAAGLKKTFAEFDREIGLEYLRMSHLNDSKFPLASRRDRHDHIGEGHIGAAGFGLLLKVWRGLETKNKLEMPLILETEHDKVKADIALLKKLRGKI